MYEIKDTMGGIEVRLPAAQGQRKFAELVLDDGINGLCVAWYDTEGMVVDMLHHIRPIERIDGVSGTQAAEFLRGKGVELAVVSDRGTPMSVVLSHASITVMDREQNLPVAEITFRSVGAMTATVRQASDGSKFPGENPRISTMEWPKIVGFLVGYGYRISAMPAPVLTSDKERALSVPH